MGSYAKIDEEAFVLPVLERLPAADLVHLRGMPLKRLETYVVEHGQKAFRARQLFAWIQERGARSFEEMTDLSKSLRQFLSTEAALSAIAPKGAHHSPDGTVKLTFDLHDGAVVESVVIPADGRVTLCVSSQVGCAMGCQFCRTATMGFVRNLSSSEIVDQVAWAKQIWESHTGSHLSNIVFMGMGEPLRNYDNVVEALQVLLDPIGLNLSKRRITVSTSGVVPILERFGGEELDVNIAISLNATTDAVRDELMPVNQKWNLAELLGALRRYPLKPNRRITFEYVMLAGVNDSDNDAKRLVKLLHGLPSKVNLIPWNPFAGARFERPDRAQIVHFKERLLAANVNVTIRESRGTEELAACGQLGEPSKAAAWREQHRDSRRRGLEQG